MTARGPLSILHVSQPSDGGVAGYVAEVAADQARRGWQVKVACPGYGQLADVVAATGARHVRWTAKRAPGPGSLLDALRLRRILDEDRPDLVHLHSSKAGLAGRLAIRGRRPTVFQPHAWSFFAVTGPMRAAAVRWERFASRWTHGLVCVSEGERDAGAAHGVRAPTWVVPNGVDCAAWQPATVADRAAARARLGVADAPHAVCVGRLCTQKGQADLLGAWATVRSALPGAQLSLVGDGPDRASLAPAADSMPGVRLVGERSDVADWLAAADVVVVPSRWEGMALVTLEAMARARSVVATDVAGTRDAVPAAAGAIVAVGDGAALAREVA